MRKIRKLHQEHKENKNECLSETSNIITDLETFMQEVKRLYPSLHFDMYSVQSRMADQSTLKGSIARLQEEIEFYKERITLSKSMYEVDTQICKYYKRLQKTEAKVKAFKRKNKKRKRTEDEEYVEYEQHDPDYVDIKDEHPFSPEGTPSYRDPQPSLSQCMSNLSTSSLSSSPSPSPSSSLPSPPPS